MATLEELQSALTSSDSVRSKLSIINKHIPSYDTSYGRLQETIIIWLVKNYEDSRDELLLQKLLSFLKNQDGEISLRLNKDVISCLINLVKSTNDGNTTENVLICSQLILSNASVVSYLKQHEKDAADVFASVLTLAHQATEHHNLMISQLSLLYEHLCNHEKAVLLLLRKCIPALACCYAAMSKCDSVNVGNIKLSIVKIINTTVFSKDGMNEFATYLDSYFEASEGDKYKKYDVLIEESRKFIRTNPGNLQIIAICRVLLEAFIRNDRFEDSALVKFIIVIAHIIGIEQNVKVADGDVMKSLIIRNDDTGIDIAEISKRDQLIILNAVLEVISSRVVNLSGEIKGTTGLQWFQALVVNVLSFTPVTESTITVLTTLMILDPSIVESSTIKVFRTIFNKSTSFSDTSFHKSYQNLLQTCLNSFYRLQRVPTFIAKFISTTTHISTDVDVQTLLPKDFIENLSSLVTTLPSAHAISLLTKLLDNLDCVNKSEETQMSTPHLQVTASLLNAVFSGCRLLCYSLPQSVVKSFTAQVQRMQEQLAQFGTLILLRPHVRSTMQAFLQMCFIWGEMITLIHCYSSEEFPPPAKDSTPSDLSSLLVFISRDQWSVLHERIANFGDEKCNQLLIKLIVQKLRVSRLQGDKSSVNTEATAKYLLGKLIPNVHGIRVSQVMEPDELSIVLDALAVTEAKSLVTTLYQQLTASGDTTLQRWIENSNLLENKKFVTALFEVVITNILQSAADDTISPAHKKLHKQLLSLTKSIASVDKVDKVRELINSVLSEETTNAIDCAADKNDILTLNNLPLAYIGATHGKTSIILVAGAMVTMNLTEQLLPFFERILTQIQDISICFDGGLFLLYLMKHVTNRSDRAHIIELLVVRSTVTLQGVLQFKRLVATLRKDKNIDCADRTQTQIHVYHAIRKCWRRGQSVDIDNALGKQRRLLLKAVRKTVESKELPSNDFVLLDAYGLEILFQDASRNMTCLEHFDFHSFLDLAISGIKEGKENYLDSCMKFLTTVLKCASSLRTIVQDEFVYKIWRELQDADCESLLQEMPLAATVKEFRRIIGDLLIVTSRSLGPPVRETLNWTNSAVLPKSLRTLFVNDENFKLKPWRDDAVNTWMIFMQKATKKKQVICQIALKSLVENSRNFLPESDANGNNLLTWLKFLHFCTINRSVKMTSSMHDFILEVILEAEEENVPFGDHFNVRSDILCALCGPRGSFFSEKIPLIFMAFKRLLSWLARESDTTLELPEEMIAERAFAAFHFEKLTGALVKRDVGKVNVFFLTEIVRAITTVTLYPPIKMHLNNSVFNLLNLADEHSVQFLMRTLPPGSQQLFSSLRGQYRKFYKFKGKI